MAKSTMVTLPLAKTTDVILTLVTRGIKWTANNTLFNARTKFKEMW